MCTVTYIPQPDGHFILSSNRDENAARSPQALHVDETNGLRVLFPRDTGAGGTWIAASDDNRVACLLNGAFVKHRHEPPYRRSRGLMVLDFFAFESAPDFAERFAFEGIEPFTFVIVDKGTPFELRWDGMQTYFKQLSPLGKYLWSSATLYPGEVGLMRQGWFKAWLEDREDFSLSAIQDFHRSGGAGDTWNGFVMNRENKVQTVSITNVVKNADGIQMIYHDLLRQAVKDGFLGFQTISA